MRNRPPQLLDMKPNGEFVGAPRAPVWPLRLGVGAAIVAAGASLLILAAFFLWVASVLLPVALAAGAVAYIAFRYQKWRVRQ